MNLPTYLKQGEKARLFPVLATTSKEGRATSILLACLSKIDEFGECMLRTVGQKIGKRTQLETFTEVVFKTEIKNSSRDRPDGLIVLNSGSKQWRALVESKVANSKLDFDQIEKYRLIAKENKLDCVITISNQFATSPENHPIQEVRKSRSKIPVFHWSWMFLLTNADLLIRNEGVADSDQILLLKELRRFLSHDSTGVTGFDRMPPEWTELNKLVSAGGTIPSKSEAAVSTLQAWHQETRDLALILSRQTRALVEERLPRNHWNSPKDRQRDELDALRTGEKLTSCLSIPNAAANLEVTCDLARRSITAGMLLKAPEDKVSTSARVRWLLRQIKSNMSADIYIRIHWPGRREPTQFEIATLREDPKLSEIDTKGISATGFFVCVSKKVGARFSQRAGFISELEEIVPLFYKEVGQHLTAWKKPAPKVRQDVKSASDVSVDAISDEAEKN